MKKFNQFLYGRHFTLITDHQPVISIFSSLKDIPAIAATRLQQWALLQGANTHSVKYKGAKLHENADGVSHLPQTRSEKALDPAAVLHMSPVETLYVTSVQEYSTR